ncbi:MAG: AAA family ATPase [Candidatus Babeliales bacterium]
MKRIVDAYLTQWKNDSSRKPLLLRGARQVGKTHAVRELGKTFDHFVEINFERSPRALAIFDNEKSLDPKRILQDIFALHDEKIIPGSTLLFFDEIQIAPRAITALRYFYEEMPELHVIAAGSLLDFAIEKIGIPVGRVRSLYMYPLSFIEFLGALGKKGSVEQLLELSGNEYSSGVHADLLDMVGKYLAVGGMPEAVNQWVKTGNINECLIVHQDIIDTYQQDFGKYARVSQIDHVASVFASIPFQLGGKFKYTAIDGDYRKRELAPAMDLLKTAGIVHQVFHTAAQGIPLGAEADTSFYKALLMDVAISQKILGLETGSWIIEPLQAFTNKGAIVEVFVGQEMLAYADPQQRAQLYYWQRMAKNSAAEVDYLLQDQEAIVPIEVKSGYGSTLKSLHMFLEMHARAKYGVRFSVQNVSVHDRVHSYPLYAVAQVALHNKQMALKALL